MDRQTDEQMEDFNRDKDGLINSYPADMFQIPCCKFEKQIDRQTDVQMEDIDRLCNLVTFLLNLKDRWIDRQMNRWKI